MRLRAHAVLGLLLALPLTATAAAISPPGLSIALSEGSGVSQTVRPSGVGREDGRFSYRGTLKSGGDWLVTYDISADPDPFIAGVFGVSNLSAIDKTFHLAVTLPVAPAILGQSLVGASLSETLTDANFDGLGLLMPDAAVSMTTYNDGTLTLALGTPMLVPQFPGDAVAAGPFVAGLPGPTILAAEALSTIEIHLDFVLSPGDNATFNAFYVVSSVPEPSTALMAAGGVAMLGLLRRRRIA